MFIIDTNKQFASSIYHFAMQIVQIT